MGKGTVRRLKAQMDTLVSYDTKDSVSGQLYGVAYVYLGSTGLMDFGVDEA